MFLPVISHPFRHGPRPSRRRDAVALVIVLAFVVLLTGLLMAFFSRAMSERQSSNSSASQTKVDLFAQGAVNTIIGDLKQEIADGSNATIVVAGSATNTIYLPTAPTNAVPALAGSTGTGGLENLVKLSANGTAFSSGANATKRAAACPTTTASKNGRFISPARWNKPLLLPATSATDTTPALTSGTYSPPDWILVARDGSNPTVWNPNMAASAGNPTSVVGRYAYAIYDEGGLLDVNVAGYPSTSTAAQSAYKPALSYADLTQIVDSSGQPILTAQQIDKLVAWRNWASTKAPGTSFSSPAFTAASGTNYFNSVVSNSSGFLKTVGAAPNNGQTDRMFTSRQELINFLQNGLGLSGTNLQTVLRYLTTFSRDINQPSLVPALSYDPNAPKILPWTATSSSGGNDAYGGDAASLVSSSGDNRVNPTFLGVRVQSPFTRNDGSQAAVGEPLVKKRFNLNRLAWLTYQGPSASRNITNPVAGGADADIYALENSFGISKSWLQQGTDANILQYFGLTWDNTNHYWIYTHGSPIKTLGQVAALAGANAREPDFFELLKASINAGALGKSGVIKNSIQLNFATQFATDSSVDYHVLQIGANIIDQFDADGYPTTIHWTNTGNTQDFVGIENLPYLDRIRPMVITAKLPIPLSDGTFNGFHAAVYYNDYADSNGNTPYKLQDTGVHVLIWIPEIWNPHDWDGNANPNAQLSFGTPAPTNFQIVCSCTDSSGNPSPGIVLNPAPVITYPTNQSKSFTPSSAVPGLSPGYPADFHSLTTNYASLQRTLTETNTAMTFSIPQNSTGAALFREPTLLFRPNKPTGSNLAAPGLNAVASGTLSAASDKLPSLAQFLDANGGIKRDSNVPTNAILPDPLTQGYIGFFLGVAPVRWVINTKPPDNSTNVLGGGTTTGNSTTYISGNYVVGPSGSNLAMTWNAFPRVKIQYEYPTSSGKWFTYDNKYSDCAKENGSLASVGSAFFNGINDFAAPFEPRTNRFGCLYSWSNGVTPNNSNGWVNLPEGVVNNTRMGVSSGFALTNPANYDMGVDNWIFNTSIGWYPGYLKWGNPNYFRPGIFAQNNPLAKDDGKNFDTSSSAGSSGANYYSDADGVVRRAAGAWVQPGAGAKPAPAATTVGLPTATACISYGNSTACAGQALTQNGPQHTSRPMILNRPFRSVAELGYAFSGTPFKQIDFFTPESGFAGLLDAFCLNDTDDANSLVAGKVNLNTRQAPVLQAILAGAYKDEWNAGGSTLSGGDTTSLAYKIASALVARTQSAAAGKGPLRNVSELVGCWVQGMTPDGSATTTSPPFGPASYDGFSADLSSILTAGSTDANIQRFRETSIRALANSGQTRVWNLLIDVVAQTGRYPQSATGLDQFLVEGEQRYWVHVAIDRFTGQVIDKQIEVVKE